MRLHCAAQLNMSGNGVKIISSMKRGGETSSKKPQQPDMSKVLKLERWVLLFDMVSPSVDGL